MSIKCGHCKDQHETVAQVRECAGQHPGLAQPSARTGDQITARQLDYLNKLRVERGLQPLPADVKMSKKDASAAISDHLLTPVNPHHPPALPPAARSASCTLPGVNRIPAGYYATDSLTGAQDTDFWFVQDGKGKWAGRTFVSRVIGGRSPQRIAYRTQSLAMQAIHDAGVQHSAFRFGQELGRCYRCGRHLTDETSRALSIGPDCRSKAA
jgi:hypothetical protein